MHVGFDGFSGRRDETQELAADHYFPVEDESGMGGMDREKDSQETGNGTWYLG